jgi:glycosyltransferase involved in cell wall biosynthesis
VWASARLATIDEVRILYLTDRLSLRGGADQHLLQVVRATAEAGARVTVAFGRSDSDALLPDGVVGERVKGLASSVASTARLGNLERLLREQDAVHVQNVMNPVALGIAVHTGRAAVTVQDHRVFCPALGKTLPSGERCRQAMSEQACAACLPDLAYLGRALQLTTARRDALRGARLLVLSRYMADELEAEGLPGAEVLPPWVTASPEKTEAGTAFLLGGRLVRHKGVLDGWRAWRAAATQLPLRLAGTGPLEGEMHGCDRLGWLHQDALRRALSSARALLFPTFWQEPFGMLGLQALAEGTPVIVAESGGSSEWSEAGCLLVAPGDIDAMATAIARLSEDPGLAVVLGCDGQRFVSARFARPALERRLMEIYAELA